MTHSTRWTLVDADRALGDGDVEGAERKLVAVARTAHQEGLASAAGKMNLASVYSTLGPSPGDRGRDVVTVVVGGHEHRPLRA